MSTGGAFSTPHATWADRYDRVYELAYGDSFQRLTALTLQQVEENVTPPARIVDFGAGTGRMSLPLAARGYQVTALEPCREMLDQLTAKPGAASIQPVVSRMQDFQAGEKYALALCVFTVLIYILDEDELQRSFQAVAAALAPGGLFLLDIPLRPLFQSNRILTSQIDRNIHIHPLGQNRYHYREVTRLNLEDGPVSYREEFDIRCWSVQQVKEALSTYGFSLARDLTTQFYEWGSKYLLMRKA